MVTKIATIIFLVAIGINLLWTLDYTALIAGIAALIAAIAMALER